MTFSKHHASIILHGLELRVHLGWPQNERIELQMVVVDITIRFAMPPAACMTDNLKDTLCYDMLTSKIKKEIGTAKFHLLEHLGYQIYQMVKQEVTNNSSISITVTKKPPIDDLKGGVSFCYAD
jgi:FolB domain-containing protein